MIASKAFLEERFTTFNELCFGGALPPVPIRLGRAVRSLGTCTYKKRQRLLRPPEYYGFTIRISTRFDLPENELEDILLHEMIHYEILVNQWQDSSAHGRLFRARMKDINERFGRHITISHRSASLRQAMIVDEKPVWRVVALVRLKDGREGIKVLPRIVQRLNTYRRGLMRSGDVASIDFYLTADPYFSRFPKSSALNIYFPSEADFRTHLPESGRLSF